MLLHGTQTRSLHAPRAQPGSLDDAHNHACTPLCLPPNNTLPHGLPCNPPSRQDLVNLFAAYGCPVAEAIVLRDRHMRMSKGCAFVWCTTPAAAEHAAAVLAGNVLLDAAGVCHPSGRPLIVRRALPPGGVRAARLAAGAARSSGGRGTGARESDASCGCPGSRHGCLDAATEPAAESVGRGAPVMATDAAVPGAAHAMRQVEHCMPLTGAAPPCTPATPVTTEDQPAAPSAAAAGSGSESAANGSASRSAEHSAAVPHATAPTPEELAARMGLFLSEQREAQLCQASQHLGQAAVQQTSAAAASVEPHPGGAAKGAPVPEPNLTGAGAEPPAGLPRATVAFPRGAPRAFAATAMPLLPLQPAGGETQAGKQVHLHMYLSAAQLQRAAPRLAAIAAASSAALAPVALGHASAAAVRISGGKAEARVAQEMLAALLQQA